MATDDQDSTAAPGPSLVDILQMHFESSMLDVHTSLVARVESYDRTTLKASVQPVVRRVEESEDGTRTAAQVPVINDVPVAFLMGAAGSVTVDLSAGDYVLVVFLGHSSDKWLTRGGDDVDPDGDDRRFDINDAVAIAGLRPFSSPLPSDATASGAMVAKSDDLRLGGALAVDPVIKGNAFMSAFDTLVAAIGTAVGGIPGGSAAGTAISGALTTFNTAASGFLSGNVKTT